MSENAGNLSNSDTVWLVLLFAFPVTNFSHLPYLQLFHEQGISISVSIKRVANVVLTPYPETFGF